LIQILKDWNNDYYQNQQDSWNNRTKIDGTDLSAIVAELGPKFASRAAQHDTEGSFVAEYFQEMRERKLFSAAIPVELGGGGASHAEMCQALRELAHYYGATALSFPCTPMFWPPCVTG